jgi:hypothetical protein
VRRIAIEDIGPLEGHGLTAATPAGVCERANVAQREGDAMRLLRD